MTCHVHPLPWHAGLELSFLGRTVLSARHADHRFLDTTRRNSTRSSSTPPSMPSRGEHRRRLARKDAGRLSFRSQVPPGNHAREGTEGLRAGDQGVSSTPWRSWTTSSARCCCRCRPSGARARWPTLKKFLPVLPPGFRYALEVRHKSWLAKDTSADLTELLRSTASRSAWCSTPGCPRWTTHRAVRLHPLAGPPRGHPRRRLQPRPHQPRRAAGPLGRAGERLSRSGLTVYGYFNNHYQGHSPASVRACRCGWTASGASDVPAEAADRRAVDPAVIWPTAHRCGILR